MKVSLPILPKIGCYGNVPWGMQKTGSDWYRSNKYLSFDEKIVKIGPVDTVLHLLNLIKNKLWKIKYSLVGKFAERAKKWNLQ